MTSPITPKATRAVSFSPDVRVKRTLHVHNYTNQEIDACWYNKVESKAIRADVLQTAKQLETTSNDAGWNKKNHYDSCTRGLESFTTEGCRLRMENRIQAWDAVLDEQERQIEEGIWDDEAMAAIYSDCCYNSMVAASIRGVSDKRALDIRTTTKTTKRLSPPKISYKQSRLVR